MRIRLSKKIISLLLTGFCVLRLQGQVLDSVISRFTEHSKKTITEKLFVHTDQATYLAGETMFFTIYCVEGSSHRPLAFSKIAYLELIDDDKKAVIQTKVELKASEGPGSLFLPSSLLSGNYVLRAYTASMRNADASLFYQQTITIINAFTPLEQVRPTNDVPYDVQFFPEGGHLVEGLRSVVGMRAVDRAGKGFSFHAVVVDDHQDTVTTITPGHFGLTRFSLKPLAGRSYSVVLRDREHHVFRYPIGQALSTGVVISVQDTLENQLRITLAAAGEGANREIVFIAYAQTNLTLAEKHSLQNGRATFLIDKGKLHDGVSHLAVLDTLRAERLYFKNPPAPLEVTVKDLHFRYPTRRKITLPVQIKTPAGDSVAAVLSMAVYKIDSLEREGPRITNYLFLTADLKGKVESPEYYLEGPFTAEKQLAVDNLMLTHGWSRFNWTTRKESVRFLPENHGHLVHARITDDESHTPAPGIQAYLTFPGAPVQLYVSKSNATGDAYFEIRDLRNKEILIAQTDLRTDSTQSLEIVSPFSDRPAGISSTSLELPERFKRDLEQRSLHLQVDHVFQKEVPISTNAVLKDSTAFYGKPDLTFWLDDYTRFPTMEEVMREYVHHTVIRKNRTGAHLFAWDNNQSDYFNTDAFVMLDGVPLFDNRKLLAFDALKVRKVEVVTQGYELGSLTAPGLISYSTYTHDLAGFPLHRKVVTLNYEGLQRQQEFFSPVYNAREENESPLPDSRHLLYWTPNLTTDAKGKALAEFTSSDISGTYRIVIQGIGRNGQAAYFTADFNVGDD